MKRLLAAVTLFTRIPAWRLAELKEEHYRKAIACWPLTGWITACIAGVIIYSFSFIMPLLPAVVLALSARTLLTSAIHEDGLADFCDGFGGGSDKEKILSIMKDSHIGTYGVIGLIIFMMLEVSLLSSLPPEVAALAIFAVDPFSKFCASHIIQRLDYARPEGAKNRILYDKMSFGQLFANMLFGIIPVIPLLLYNKIVSFSFLFPIMTLIFLLIYLRKKISGYTGDCCGAACLMCEVSMLIGIVIIVS